MCLFLFCIFLLQAILPIFLDFIHNLGATLVKILNHTFFSVLHLKMEDSF